MPRLLMQDFCDNSGAANDEKTVQCPIQAYQGLASIKSHGTNTTLILEASCIQFYCLIRVL